MNNYESGLNVVVDLDAEQGRPPNPRSKNEFRLVVRKTKAVNLAVLNAWLNRQCDMNDSVLEALSE